MQNPIIYTTPNDNQAFILADLVKKNHFHCHIVNSDRQLEPLKQLISFIDSSISVLIYPNWDTLPYDRVSPKSDIVANQMQVLHFLATYTPQKTDKILILTTASAILQLAPPLDFITQSHFEITMNNEYSFDTIKSFLIENMYQSRQMVLEMGEFAIRGGLIDIFPANFKQPVRIDFFGDVVDSIKSFDPLTQRTIENITDITIAPMGAFKLDSGSITRFRSQYRACFSKTSDDFMYQSVSNGVYVAGLEHFLPLFYDKLSHFFDYIAPYSLSFDTQLEQVLENKYNQIIEYYTARCEGVDNPLLSPDIIYNPIKPDLFYVSNTSIFNMLQDKKTYCFNTVITPPLFEPTIKGALDFIHNQKMPVFIAAFSKNTAKRLQEMFQQYNMILQIYDSFKSAIKSPLSLIIQPFEHSFIADNFICISESSIFGKKIGQGVKKRKNIDFITDIDALQIDDYIVHDMHGVGIFKGLTPITVDLITHDCLLLEYSGGDKLFVPVENIDVLSKYGATAPTLDTLGGTSFITRKENVKKDLFIMAHQLLETASLRYLHKTTSIAPDYAMYQEFCARFKYVETPDQLQTMQDIERDLLSQKSMDRLVCGDVGFGKTEIALRTAFLLSMAGYQVAIIVPTTILAMQHYQSFITRFEGFPIRIGQLSRLISAKNKKLVYDELKSGTMDIVIGTHALLSKNISFHNLGLVIIDEEQHFGVAHKEHLKQLKKGVHVLTLTATPIPRTLQLSLTGVRDLSLIATPPIDRLAVKTFITPFDPIIIKEALLREHFRGGQSFIVAPKIADLVQLEPIIKALVPTLKMVQAHGQMAATQLENIMLDFNQGTTDILLSTSIIESGLDMPGVNTIIIYKADGFGLSALYQLRGRVGRGKTRAYAYLTTTMHKKLTPHAEKRLSVMQQLDTLGAGFTLASHDLDIRGAGNLLGDDQSGHIRQVGVALYQKMLVHMIEKVKNQQSENAPALDDDFSPKINCALSVLIPENYVADLSMRMRLYNRVSHLSNDSDIEDMKNELTDRFGKYPIEVNNLFYIIKLKLLCKKARIEKLDITKNGAVIAFYQQKVNNPTALINFIYQQQKTLKITPTQQVIVSHFQSDLGGQIQYMISLIEKIDNLDK